MAFNLAGPNAILAFAAYYHGEIHQSLEICILEWIGDSHGDESIEWRLYDRSVEMPGEIVDEMPGQMPGEMDYKIKCTVLSWLV